MIDITELTPGESYACRFRLVKDEDTYESIGLLLTRDLEQKLVKLRDTQTLIEFVVSFDDVWDIDHVNWTDLEAES
jgi:hypothetical protein